MRFPFLIAASIAVAASGCFFQGGYLRPQGLPSCQRVALAGITVQRQAVSSMYDYGPYPGVAGGMYPMATTVPLEHIDQIPPMFRRMLERSGLIQFMPESEELAYPGFQSIAQQYPSRAAFMSDSDLYSPQGYPVLTDEPRHAAIQSIAVATGADAVVWGRVRFELRSDFGLYMTSASVFANVDVILYDRNGDEAWRDSGSAQGGYVPGMTGLTGGFLGGTPVARAAEDGFVSAMGELIHRLQDRLKEQAGRKPR